jgi:DNA polymerase-3 subunit delta'
VAARHPVHAYLLVGPAGSGTREAARGFAAALLCPDGGCGVCPHCRRALAGTHPDLVTVERTGAALGIDEARRLVVLAQRRPLEARRQVLVVTDVHLAERSAPALLKTVEEPPPSTVFVLLADDVPPELATVASRCVEVVFPPVPVGEVTAWLTGRGVDPDRARAVAEGAGGDLRRARLLAEDDRYAARLALWRSVPERLDGSGASVAQLVTEVRAASDGALEPLRAEHAATLVALEEEASSMGERGVPGRKEITDRQHREENRWRADELRAGLGVLARAYRHRMGSALQARDPASAAAAARGARAVDLITEAAASMIRNPNETLLLESLLSRLGALESDGG